MHKQHYLPDRLDVGKISFLRNKNSLAYNRLEARLVYHYLAMVELPQIDFTPPRWCGF
jgi:hypothetical protein